MSRENNTTFAESVERFRRRQGATRSSRLEAIVAVLISAKTLRRVSGAGGNDESAGYRRVTTTAFGRGAGTGFLLERFHAWLSVAVADSSCRKGTPDADHAARTRYQNVTRSSADFVRLLFAREGRHRGA
jgi:hypothetical protein